MTGNRIPERYLRKLYGDKHWLFSGQKENAPGDVPSALSKFLADL
jgi:hypothetical protein